MPSATSVVLNDGQATPVAVTFVPERVSPDLSTFVDRSTGIAMLFPRLGVSTKFAKSGGKVNRATFTIALPVGQLVNGVQTVARVYRVNVEMLLPDGGTDAERKNVFAFLTNGLNNSLIKGALRDYDPIV